MFLAGKKGGWWRWGTLALAVAALALYSRYAASEGYAHGGSTWGLLFGLAALALFVKLLLFGLRKRAYRSTFGSLEGWLHAHVWLGLLTLLLVLLHTGFRFRDRLALTAFAVMAVVVASGIVGVYLYTIFPRLLTDTGRALDGKETSKSLNRLGDRMAAQASGRSPGFQAVYRQLVKRSNPRPLQGWRFLLRRPGDDEGLVESGRLKRLLGQIGPGEQEALEKLLSLSKQRQELYLSFARQRYYRNWMELWLWVHLPLSVALVALVAAHVVAALFFSGALETMSGWGLW